MRPKTKKFLVLVLLAIVSAVGIGGILGSNAAWADIRQTVRNGNSYMVVNNPYASTINNMTIPGATSGISGNASSSGGMQTSSFNVSGEGGEGEGEYGPEYECDDIADRIEDGSAGALEWVMCPAMDNTRYTASYLDKKIQNWLEIKTDIYSGSVVNDAWGNIRNVANLVMVVFLILIIASQITGYGIDNYGIKKMLPRLITMAIIVNLSLYICQLAVDFSNILGTGLRDMFGSFGGGEGSGGIIGSGILAMFATSGSAVAGISTVTTVASIAGLTVTAFWAILIVVLIIVLVILVAVAILLGMVGVRKILVMFCIIVSPLAFVAFIFPNTQGLSKKWWNLFKTALVIYPICGAVAGISTMLINMAKQTESLHWYEIGIVMVIPYLVYFLIPMLVKEAISGLGKLGGALTSMGSAVKGGARTLGSGAMRAAQNSEWGKRNMEMAARRRQERSANKIMGKYNSAETAKKLEDAKRRMDANPDDRRAKRDYEKAQGEQRRAARASETLRKLDSENLAAATILTEKEYAGKSQQDLMNAWNKAFDSGDVDKMNALTNVITSRHGPGGVSAIASDLATKTIFDGNEFAGGDDGPMAKSFTALQANMMQNSALANAMQNKASDVFQMVSGGGFYTTKDKNGNKVTMRGNVSAHAANNSISTQLKDWATQSNGTLQRAAANNGLSAQMARDLLKSTDPAIQSGIQSDKDKRATLEAIAGGYVGKDWGNTSAVEQAATQYRGMDGDYAGRTADSVHAEALAVNAEFDRRKQQEMNDLHAQALEENKEFDRRAAEQARIEARDKTSQQMADAMDRLNNNLERLNNNSSRQNVDMNSQSRPGDGYDGFSSE